MKKEKSSKSYFAYFLEKGRSLLKELDEKVTFLVAVLILGMMVTEPVWNCVMQLI